MTASEKAGFPGRVFSGSVGFIFRPGWLLCGLGWEALSKQVWELRQRPEGCFSQELTLRCRLRTWDENFHMFQEFHQVVLGLQGVS